mmetsp:Transcript_14663/g.20520  ORF Transcript_14663/g.20520 Transcript_14663/m.20520 type:complete len:122 (+) Transcript_14663:156-521(+)
MDRCREHIAKTPEDETSELIICPTNYPAIDGATNCRTLYQVTISSRKFVDQAYVDELKCFGAKEGEKAAVFFLVPKSISEHFGISFARGLKTVALKLAKFWVVGVDVVGMIKDAQTKSNIV